MTPDLTALERAALGRIAERHPAARLALEAQLPTLRVVRRAHTGVGFFTDLSVDRTAPPIASAQRVFGDVAASIEGLEQPMILLLFAKDGYAEMIEGATVGRDSTVGLDLASLCFTMVALSARIGHPADCRQKRLPSPPLHQVGLPCNVAARSSTQ